MTDTETHKFSNGLQLVLEKLPKAKSAGVAVGFPVGGRTEEPHVSGISHYLEHMIFKGTKTVKNVDATFEKLGARNNAMTEVDTTVYVAECPKKYSIRVLDLWLHLLSEASIEPEEFECERGVILSEYFITEDNPDSLVDKTATLTLFKEHPLSTTVIGSEETIKAITHSKMHDYFRSLYSPSNTVVWVSGDLTLENVIDCVKNHDYWTRSVKGPAISYKKFQPQGPSATELRRPIKLLQVGLALSGQTGSAEERASLQILGSMLSSGQSSILRRRLVLEAQLTDKLRTVTSCYKEAGMLFTTFATRPDKASRVLNILIETLSELREDTDTFKEHFENARNHAIGLLATNIDNTMMYRTLQGAWETLRRGHCGWDELSAQLETLEFSEFKKNVAEMSRPERTALILAGDVREGSARKLQF
ncbi:MAG: pitrilysin family protein [Candidatus Bathyarchaeia archaeon]|jgi:predicted Zn-dependent peptidase